MKNRERKKNFKNEKNTSEQWNNFKKYIILLIENPKGGERENIFEEIMAPKFSDLKTINQQIEAI